MGSLDSSLATLDGDRDVDLDSLSTESQRIKKNGVAIEQTPITSFNSDTDPYPAILDNLPNHDRYVFKVSDISPGGNYRIGLQINGLTAGYSYNNAAGESGGGSFFRLTSDGGNNVGAGEIRITTEPEFATIAWEMGVGRSSGWGKNTDFSGPLTKVAFDDFNGGGGTDLRFALIGEDVILP